MTHPTDKPEQTKAAPLQKAWDACKASQKNMTINSAGEWDCSCGASTASPQCRWLAPSESAGERPKLTLDWGHYPADAAEGWEMLCRAKAKFDNRERRLREALRQLKDTEELAEHITKKAFEWQQRAERAEAAQIPEGLALVPREPTDKMIMDAMHCLDGVNLKTKGHSYAEQKYYKYIARYKAMLAAAPTVDAIRAAKTEGEVTA